MNMNMNRTESLRFEDRLLERLSQVVAEHPAPAGHPPRHRGRGHLAIAGAGCAAALAAVGIVARGGGTTTSAYAVETQPSGAVEVSINSVSDAAGLQRSLEDRGVPALVDFDPADQAACNGTPPPATKKGDADSVKAYESAEGALWAELPPRKAWADPHAHSKVENAFGDLSGNAVGEAGGSSFLVDPSRIETGDKLVITTSDGTVKTLEISVASEGTAAGCGAS
jgi:hypothetical protein